VNPQQEQKASSFSENLFKLEKTDGAIRFVVLQFYIRAAKSPATLRTYRTDFEDFTRICEERNLPHLPATPIAVALVESSLRRERDSHGHPPHDRYCPEE
jgi:site-specific recombinase XerD